MNNIMMKVIVNRSSSCAVAAIIVAFMLSVLQSTAVAETDAATAPFVGAIAASLSTNHDFEMVFYDINGNAKRITNLTSVGGLLPMESAFVAHLNAVAFLTIGAQSGAVIMSTKGDVLGKWFFANLVLTNIEYDISLQAIYMVGYVPSESKNYLWQLFENGTVSKIVPLPGTVQLGISTYCHTFFATVQTNGQSGNGLIKIDTQGKKVSPVIELSDGVEMLFWDYDMAIMYGLVATETQAALLVTVNIDNGKRNSTIVGFNNLSSNPDDGAGATFNIKSKVITGAFIDIAQSSLPPYWVTINAQTGKVTSVEYNYGYAINVLVNAAQ